MQFLDFYDDGMFVFAWWVAVEGKPFVRFYPIVRNIRATAAGGIYAAPTKQPNHFALL